MTKYLSKIAKGNSTLHIKDAEARLLLDMESLVEYVDLGLPSGTLWAKCNIGANSETDYGNYYMYGKGASTYNSSESAYTGTENPLSSEADTATQVLGAPWHMPTKAQFEELEDNTTYTWEINFNGSGVNGAKFTAQNGEYLFIPAAGMAGSGSSSVGANGYCWSSIPAYYNNKATYFYSGDGSHGTDSAFRTLGFSVRAVCNTFPFKKLSDKADKDTDAVEGNFAAFDANGNPVDSGHKHSDYLTSHQSLSHKADKVSGATLNNLAALNSNGNLKDSGIAASAVAMASDLSDEVDRATAAEEALQALYQALTQSDIVVVTELPATGTANTIYRVPDSNFESYSDYMYYNSNWMHMATYTCPMDVVPTEDSLNLVFSGGVYEWGAEAAEIVADTSDDWDPGTAEEYFEQIQQEVTTLTTIVQSAQLEAGVVQQDLVPTENSGNFVNSGVVYAALHNLGTANFDSNVVASLGLADNSVQFGELVGTVN